MSLISIAEVRHVALLARLRLSDPEIDELAVHLAQILTYVEQLGELDAQDVQPLAHVGDLFNILADDVERPSLDRDSVFFNAPKHDHECFRVPAVLGED